MARGKPLDPDLVKAVFRLYRREKSVRKVGEIFDKSHVWATQILHKYDEQTGLPKEAAKKRGRPRRTTEEQDKEALAFLAENPELSAAQASSTVQIPTRTLLRRMKEFSGKKRKEEKKTGRKTAVTETLPTMTTVSETIGRKSGQLEQSNSNSLTIQFKIIQ
ncbi:uncharacterized protein LOC129591479 [Paramacrobiotus metropolitanus]|uniref:uncharacterized protein LOC129591479 n=1 Tax=Paramacrobiotus metropolitanus TaxID=2943436 RepID=UPI0024458243|nr:uncharacterized protein LOC129591479 [Paramacrobiotus metropolitanus]